MCDCNGSKAVLEIYEDNCGLGKILVQSSMDSEPRELLGEIHTAKVKCFECGQIYLMEMTFPDVSDIDELF